MERKMFDCRPWPGDCTVVISGAFDEVVELQALHAVHAHGQQDTPELRSMIRAALTDSPKGA